MKISFHGAARTVTGSKHILTLTTGEKILLDCGMFQGLGAETDSLNRDFGFDPSAISLLLLSHAHIDHSGLIPKLVKEGFAGKIVCTEATRELTEILLLDSAEIQASDAERLARSGNENNQRPPEPLYTAADVTQALELFRTVDCNNWFSPLPNVEVCFTASGHLVGAAAVTLRIKEGRRKTTVLFSGDVGRYRSVLLQPPAEPPQADYVIMESTYGSSHHDVSFNLIKTLRQWIEKVCVERGGQLVIPAFSVGRTQEILYGLNQLSLEKRLPELLYFVDSPLSQKATQTIKKFTPLFNERLQQVLAIDDDPFDFLGLKYVESAEDSRRLVEYDQPCVIISSSGTADAGRVRHHIHNCLRNRASAVLLVGYCGSKSLGGQLAGGAKEVDLFGNSCLVLAEVGQMQGMSAHADADELLQFLGTQQPEKVKGVFLVHGEPAVQKEFASRLKAKGFNRVECPDRHQEYELPLKPVRVRKRIPLAKPLIAADANTAAPLVQ